MSLKPVFGKRGDPSAAAVSAASRDLPALRRLRIALVITLAAFGGGAASAAPFLPPPSGDPQRIDFAADPVLAFVRASGGNTAMIGDAVARHPAVAAATADVQATRGVRLKVRSALFPQLDASLVAGRQLARDFGSRDTIVESLQPRGRTDALLNGDQLLFDWGATSSRIAAADARTAAARAEVGQVAADTALAAAAAAAELTAARTLTRLAADTGERQAAILEQVRARVDQGLGAGGDVARAEAMLADAGSLAARARRQLGRAEARYREAFGDTPPPVLPRSAPPSSGAQSLDAAIALARRAPLVQAALQRAGAARLEAKAVRADGRPRLSAGIAATRYDAFSGSDYEVRGQLVLRHSLFAGGRQRGAESEAAARASAAGSDADRIAGESERDAGAAFADVAALADALASATQAYVAGRRVRDTYAEQFRLTRGTLIELLRAEQDYQAAAAALLQGALDLDVARFVLLARTGELLPALGVTLDAREGTR